MSNYAKSNIKMSFTGWLKNQFVEKKFNSPLGFALMMIWGVAIAYVTSEIDYKVTAISAAVVIGVLIFMVCFRYPLFGLYFTIVFSCLFALPGRIFGVLSPIGILVEVFTYVLWLSVLGNYNIKKEKMAAFWRNPITVLFIIIMVYYFIEIGNPASASREGWFFFIRKQISYFLTYHIAYVVLDSYDKIRSFLKFWIILVLVIALYGIKQQWLGLAQFETNWLRSDRLLLELFFQGGFLRKFSFLTDPAAFGVICAAFGLLTLVLAMRVMRKKLKYFLYLATLICFLASSYSGSRTCNLMIVAGLASYALFTLNEKRTYVLMFTFACIATFLLLGPFENNPVVYRIKTTFQPSRDASASLRDINRHNIQPYIHTHPIGGGLNTSSLEGKLYNPGHVLAGFPPDSGFMKILLEQGWIGFAIHLIFYFVILKQGIDGFFRARNRNIQNIHIALTVCLFSLIVGQYSQVAIAQYPLMLFFFPALSILVKLIDYDTQNPETNHA